MVLLVGCSPVRRLKKDEYLLRKNKILHNNTVVTNEELQTYLRQKPNKKIFGFWRFHLQLYNLVNKEKFDVRYGKRMEKRALVNARRKEAGKKERSAYPVSFSRWLLTVGEAPVAFDSLALERSSRQLELLLKNNGYFNAQVSDSVHLRKHRRADAVFRINAGTPYRLDTITYDIPDETVKDLLMENNAGETLLRSGDLYNTDRLDRERDRITNYLKDRGYFMFVKNYVTYSADSTVGDYRMNLTVSIANPSRRVPGYVDSTVEIRHTRYKINNIYVSGNYKLRPDSTVRPDTLYFDNIYYVSDGLLKFKPRALKPAIYIDRGDLYSKRLAERTYRRISDYRSFRFINIQFRPVNVDSSDLLNCDIQVSPMARQAFMLQTQGTNTGGNLGVAADLIYQNRNLLRGLELFEFRLNGGLEVQRIVNTADDDNTTIQEFLPFNTLLIGPEISVQFPRLLWPFRKIDGFNQKTRISSSYNFQQRPDYQRSIFNLIYGYSWSRFNRRVQGLRSTFILNPSEISFVDVTLSPGFENLLNTTNNLFLRNSFTSQFITAMKAGYILTNQRLGEHRNFFFLQTNLETSGLMFNATRAAFINPGIVDGKYVVFGIPYSQYIRFDLDVRQYYFFNSSSSLALRQIVGLGIPYGNSSVMPFVKSFFVGGANGIRAWTARSLGPGSYRNETGLRFDQIGDIKLELNLEYRLKLYRIFESAAYLDLGNIWLRQKDPFRANAEFDINRFYKEIAVGTGIGLRLNFDYFIIRVDTGHPLYDPSYPEGERWSFNRLRLDRVVFNLGIGYPF